MSDSALCPFCGRELAGVIEAHHMTPKCRKGKLTENIHQTCHRFLHATWSEKQLERFAKHGWETVKQEPLAIAFIKWIANKAPDFYIKIKENNNRRK